MGFIQTRPGREFLPKTSGACSNQSRADCSRCRQGGAPQACNCVSVAFHTAKRLQTKRRPLDGCCTLDIKKTTPYEKTYYNILNIILGRTEHHRARRATGSNDA